MKKIAILTSGGDAPGMNAAIRAVVRTSIFNDVRIYGVKMGYNGLIDGDIEELNLSSVADIIHRGGTILGTARSEMFMTELGRKKALHSLEKLGIEGLIVVGGDGSMRGALELSKLGFPTITIPATIDNDLGYTDYTIGFMTAVETATDAISKLRDTSSAHGRANVVEVMGRRCGDIALYAGIAGGAETIFVPEEDISIDDFIDKALNGVKRGKRHHIIVVSEGAKRSSFEIKNIMEEKTNIETKITVLGHVQRGGTPTVFDRILASEMGNLAVKSLIDGKFGFALQTRCGEIKLVEIEKALLIKKEFRLDLLKLANVLSI